MGICLKTLGFLFPFCTRPWPQPSTKQLPLLPLEERKVAVGLHLWLP